MKSFVILHLFFCQKLVVENMDMLVQMKNNFENPEKMEGLKKKLTGEDWKWDLCTDGGRCWQLEHQANCTFSDNPASTVIHREDSAEIAWRQFSSPHFFPLLSYYKQYSPMRQFYNNKRIYRNLVEVTHILTEYCITPKAYCCFIRNHTELHG